MSTDAALSTHTVTGVVEWAHSPSHSRPGCACCVDVPGLPAGRHIYGYSVALPEDTPGATGPGDTRATLRAWLYSIYSAKRTVPDGSRIRVTVEVLPPESPHDPTTREA